MWDEDAMRDRLSALVLGVGVMLTAASPAAADCPGPGDPPSSLGCEFYAVDLENDSLNGNQFSVVVVNPDSIVSANVDVEIRLGGVWQQIATTTVAADAQHQFDLPDRHISGTGLSVGGAYRVTSDEPIAAFQFQPSVTSFSSDASVLLPTNALSREYRVSGWGPVVSGFRPQLVLVGQEDGTTVDLSLTATTIVGGGVPSIPASPETPTPLPVTLDAGDFVQLASDESLAGSLIEADAPLAVFSAHSCAEVPIGVGFCDHLEEQLVPRRTWGQTHVAARMVVRAPPGPSETSYWQVIAGEQPVGLTYIHSPDVTFSGRPASLAAGAVETFTVDGTSANPGDFILLSNAPVALVEYMSGSANPRANVGDPAMTQVVPVEQYRSDYVVTVGSAWINDFVVVTKRIGETVQLDGVTIPGTSFTPIDAGTVSPEWEVARWAVTDGRHELTGSAPFGVTVVSYDNFSSYAFPGGMNQLDLETPVLPVPTMPANASWLLLAALSALGVFALSRPVIADGPPEDAV